MLRYRRVAGSLLNSSWGAGFSARLEHEPTNFPASPLALMRKFMSMIKTIALAIRIAPQAAIRCDGIVGGSCSWYKYPQVGFLEILPYLMATWALKVASGLHVCTCMCVCSWVSMCGTYIFTAGVLQSSGQDLGCSSPQCLPLPLGTEHMELPLFLLTQRVTITHLIKTEERYEWTSQVDGENKMLMVHPSSLLSTLEKCVTRNPYMAGKCFN